MSDHIPFNRPFIAGKELSYIAQAVSRGELTGDGYFTQRCCRLLENRLGLRKVLLTPSCTAALEMSAMLCGIEPGDEVIMPSYTSVSTANAFLRMGARPAFVDIAPDTLNIDAGLIEAAVTERTKAIVPVHYGGVGCDMDRILAIAKKYGVRVVEDAAQGINAFYRDQALGSMGDLGAYSFHETKNLISGEGGALCINDPELIERAEIIRDKGTDRGRFLRGEVDKYSWVDVGSSYDPSEICSAFLLAQLELMDEISSTRRRLFESYTRGLRPFAADGLIRIPQVPPECESSHHVFYIILPNGDARDALIAHLSSYGIAAVFHFVPLHTSPMGLTLGYQEGNLPVTEDLSRRLVRLPLFHGITPEEQARVISSVGEFLETL